VPPLPKALSFKRRLLRWYRHAGRRLPWRATRDPYRILVSEFMLQQTQVSRVEQYYPRFLGRYPTLQDLARARSGAVREAWDGLGYYRRASNLHRLAQVVIKSHGGRVPEDGRTLEELPGVGPYTAAAVASFAYQRRRLPVDTNVARVLRRVFGLRVDHARGRRRLSRVAGDLLPRRGPVAWEFNQAMMDLGATICKARKPACSQCPVRPACATGSKLGTRRYSADTA
jgi:A/G-specific adenine glycosylase